MVNSRAAHVATKPGGILPKTGSRVPGKIAGGHLGALPGGLHQQGGSMPQFPSAALKITRLAILGEFPSMGTPDLINPLLD